MQGEALSDVPRIAVSIERTINLGNYESAKVFLSVSNLMMDATDEEIAEALETSQRAHTLLKAKVRDQVKEIRERAGRRPS